MDKIATLQNFFMQFLPAYEEHAIYSAPTKPSYPYITYEGIFSRFNPEVSASTSCTFSTWYREAGWSNAVAKTAEISRAIPHSGLRIPCDEGVVVITAESDPFGQRMGDESDDLIKRTVHRINVTFFTLN